jgi:hypothetical protein
MMPIRRDEASAVTLTDDGGSKVKAPARCLSGPLGKRPW